MFLKVYLFFIYQIAIKLLVFFFSGECRFPSTWEGSWFQSGIRDPMIIRGNFTTSKGTCLESDGDKFLMEDT